MARILGIGGIFYKSPSPKATQEWYARVLGFEIAAWGGAKFPPLTMGKTVWSTFPAETDYFDPSHGAGQSMMINFVVDDLDGVLARAASHGVEPLKVSNDDPQGRFAWLVDADGMKIELWQPNA